MNRIQSKDHEIGTQEINKISLPCFDDKIYIQNNGCDGLDLGNEKKSCAKLNIVWKKITIFFKRLVSVIL